MCRDSADLEKKIGCGSVHVQVYGLTINDDVSLKRNGGFGSTTK